SALGKQTVHRFRGEHLGREGRHRSADQDVQFRYLLNVLNRLLQRHAAGQHRAEADLSIDIEAVVNGRAAEVGINEQNTNVALGEDAGEVHGDGRLAFAWGRAGQ